MARHPSKTYPALQGLMERLGIVPKKTEFYRRARDYAIKAEIQARGRAAWDRSPRNKNAISK